MTRFLLSSTVMMLLAAPVAASAATRHLAPHTAPVHKIAAMSHHAAKHSGARMAKSSRSRDGGSAAVDALNDQALARARAGQ